jgi:hypothetical protein
MRFSFSKSILNRSVLSQTLSLEGLINASSNPTKEGKEKALKLIEFAKRYNDSKVNGDEKAIKIAEEAYKAQKSQCPVIYPHLAPKNLGTSQVDLPKYELSGFICIDIDLLENGEKPNEFQVYHIVDSLIKMPEVAYAANSVSGLGAYAIIKVGKALTRENFVKVWKKVASYVKESLKKDRLYVQIDEAPKNPHSARFITAPIYFKYNMRPSEFKFDLKEIQEEVKVVEKIKPSYNASNNEISEELSWWPEFMQSNLYENKLGKNNYNSWIKLLFAMKNCKLNVKDFIAISKASKETFNSEADCLNRWNGAAPTSEIGSGWLRSWAAGCGFRNFPKKEVGNKEFKIDDDYILDLLNKNIDIYQDSQTVNFIAFDKEDIKRNNALICDQSLFINILITKEGLPLAKSKKFIKDYSIFFNTLFEVQGSKVFNSTLNKLKELKKIDTIEDSWNILKKVTSRFIFNEELTNQEDTTKVLTYWLLAHYNQVQTGNKNGAKTNQYALVLHSNKQGVGKSSFFLKLGDYFGGVAPISKDQRELNISMTKPNIILIDEIDTFVKRHNESELKRLLNKGVISERKLYTDKVFNLPQLASFAGTTNSDSFMNSKSDRRYLILPISDRGEDDKNLPTSEEIWSAVKTLYENGILEGEEGKSYDEFIKEYQARIASEYVRKDDWIETIIDLALEENDKSGKKVKIYLPFFMAFMRSKYPEMSKKTIEKIFNYLKNEVKCDKIKVTNSKNRKWIEINLDLYTLTHLNDFLIVKGTDFAGIGIDKLIVDSK